MPTREKAAAKFDPDDTFRGRINNLRKRDFFRASIVAWLFFLTLEVYDIVDVDISTGESFDTLGGWFMANDKLLLSFVALGTALLSVFRKK